MHRCPAHIALPPWGAMLVGKTLFLAGSILIVGAVFARKGVSNHNTARAEAKLPPVYPLAQAYPQYPTWIVPEGPVGFGIAALLVVVGMTITVLAERAGKR